MLLSLKLAKAFKPKSDFETRIFRYDFVKILANPLGFAAFCAALTKKSVVTKFSDLKGAFFVWFLVKRSS